MSSLPPHKSQINHSGNKSIMKVGGSPKGMPKFTNSSFELWKQNKAWENMAANGNKKMPPFKNWKKYKSPI